MVSSALCRCNLVLGSIINLCSELERSPRSVRFERGAGIEPNQFNQVEFAEGLMVILNSIK